MSGLTVVLPALLLAVAPMAACAGAFGPPAAPGAASGEGSGDAAVELRAWTHQADVLNDGLDALAEAYMAENFDVSITFETLKIADTYIQTLQTALPAELKQTFCRCSASWVCAAESPKCSNLPSIFIFNICNAEGSSALPWIRIKAFDCKGH